MQNYWNLDLNVNGDSLPGPLIIGTFEKRAPGPCTASSQAFSVSTFRDVSKTLGPRDPKPIGRTIAENWKKNHCWQTKYQIHLWGSPVGFFNPVISNLISRNPVIPIVIFEIPYPRILSIPNLALVLL